MEREEGGNPSLGELLLETSLPDGKRHEFFQLYFDHEGRIEKFWEKLKPKAAFKDHVADLKLAFELGALTRNHLPLLRELKKLGTHGVLKSVRELADLEEAVWKKLIEKKVAGKPVGFPQDTLGDNEEDKIGNYARALVVAVEAAGGNAGRQRIPAAAALADRLSAGCPAGRRIGRPRSRWPFLGRWARARSADRPGG